MITRFIKEITTTFNPFSPQARTARLVLSFLPSNARSQGMTVNTTLLPRTATQSSSLFVKFNDGKEMNLNCEALGIKGVIEEIDRHSRTLQKQADLNS